MDALVDAGWEEYPYPDPWPGMDPWYWIPAKHKNYWQDGRSGERSDNYMQLKDAISWQLHTDTGHLTEELDVS